MSLSGSLQRPYAFVTLCRMKYLITLIGLVLILEGLPYVAAPEAMQRWLSQLTRIPPSQLRMMGLVAMAAGFLILIFARHSGLLQ